MTGAAIFDLDATLVDSQQVSKSSFIDAFHACGLFGEPPASAFLELSGIPLEQVCVQLKLPIEGFPEQFRSASRLRRSELKLFPGILDLLETLHNRRIPMGIITGKDRARTLETMQLLRIERYFDAVATPDDPPAPKPSPEGVSWLCHILHATPSESVLVGDSVLDVRTGRAAGSTTIGCTWGIADHATLTNEGADLIAESVQRLSEYLYTWYERSSGDERRI